MSGNGLDAVLLAGPTASGKSAFGLELAERFNGVIINADSMQVYSGLSLITARPDTADMARVPHHLYGHVAPDQGYSVGDWLSDVETVLETVRADGHLPIILGGTGLYFSALLNGLSPVPDISAEVRAYWRQFAEEQGADALYEVLCERDDVMASRLEVNDRQRVIRALEVLDETGRSLAAWQDEDAGPSLLDAERVARLILAPSREVLYERINMRFDQMLRQGALDEVQAVRDMELASSLPVMKAIGVPQLGHYLDGVLTEAEAIELAKRDSRRYAKRQGTWFRNQFQDWKWIEPQHDMEGGSGNFCKVIKEIETSL